MWGPWPDPMQYCTLYSTSSSPKEILSTTLVWLVSHNVEFGCFFKSFAVNIGLLNVLPECLVWSLWLKVWFGGPTCALLSCRLVLWPRRCWPASGLLSPSEDRRRRERGTSCANPAPTWLRPQYNGKKERGGWCFVDYCGYNREYREFVQWIGFFIK